MKGAFYFFGVLLFPSLIHALKFDQPVIDDGFGNRTIWSITQDKKKFIWLATTQNVLRYDGYEFHAVEIPETVSYKKRTIHIDDNNHLWIGTGLGELYSLYEGRLTIHGIVGEESQQLVADKKWQINQITSYDGFLYIASQQGLFIKNILDNSLSIVPGIDQTVKGLWVKDSHSIYVAYQNQLVLLNPVSNKLEVIHQFDGDERARVLHLFNETTLYVGTTRSLYNLELTNNQIEQVQGLPQDTILSLASDNHRLWIGSLTKGLFLLNIHTQEISNYKHQPNTIGSLSDDVIVSIFLEASGALFLGTFDANLNTTHTQRLQFGTITGSQYEYPCIKSNVIYHIYEDQKGGVWLSTANGVINLNNNTCDFYGAEAAENTLLYPEIRSISQTSDDNSLWVATNQGLNLLDMKNQSVDRLTGIAPRLPTTFALTKSPNEVLVGTESGLFLYQPNKGQFTRFKSSEPVFELAQYFAHSFSDSSQIDYFATDLGVVQLSDQLLVPINKINQQLEGAAIGDIHINQADSNIFISTTENGLYHFKNLTYELINHWRPGYELPERSQLLDILQDHYGNLWISSRNGLFRFKVNTTEVEVFYEEHGLQGNTFKRGASFLAPDNKLYFGGLNGLNAFYPQNIPYGNRAPDVYLTHFRLFNQISDPVKKNKSQLSIHDIDQLNQIELSHKDYIFGFEFASLDFTAPNRIKYAHKLLGLEPDWNITNAQNRHVSYTNLDPGRYTFQVKAAKPSGQWSESVKSLDIIIKPAPWFTWWAYTIYATLIIFSIIVFIKYKLKQQQTMSEQLKHQVDQQTRQIRQQKEALQMVVSKKNELFSNVTHEFRTPLTLILGPVDQLLNSPELSQHHDTFNLIRRNARKLLKLVDQLMLLARSNEHNKLVKTNQNAQATIKALVSTFEHSAKEKDISLLITKLEPGSVKVTEDAIEIILGNLLSNAIKYTQPSGKVEVSAYIKGRHLEIKVQDNGPGIAAHHLDSVFERFTRLGDDQTIEGIGIGLALAQEIAKANNSLITVSSKPQKGSTFAFKLLLCENEEIGKPSSEDLNHLHTVVQDFNHHSSTLNKNYNEKPSLLMIEDNKDMQSHLLSELGENYSCVIADDGEAGIELACQAIPDIILCDVMMPKRDGFEVCRTLRSNPLTCHIPLVLLTALNDKSYRIKGWRQGVDLFLTKPFDANELRLQLHNILNIRKAINLRNQKHFLNHSDQQTLPEVDAKFVKKFKQCVAQNYQDTQLNVSKMANLLHVSERQLQRKCKSLLDLSPSELLREWRLKKALNLLEDGLQVAQVADHCGFNSISYFSHSFKVKYGTPPKQYQKKYMENFKN